MYKVKRIAAGLSITALLLSSCRKDVVVNNQIKHSPDPIVKSVEIMPSPQESDNKIVPSSNETDPEATDQNVQVISVEIPNNKKEQFGVVEGAIVGFLGALGLSGMIVWIQKRAYNRLSVRLDQAIKDAIEKNENYCISIRQINERYEQLRDQWLSAMDSNKRLTDAKQGYIDRCQKYQSENEELQRILEQNKRQLNKMLKKDVVKTPENMSDALAQIHAQNQGFELKIKNMKDSYNDLHKKMLLLEEEQKANSCLKELSDADKGKALLILKKIFRHFYKKPGDPPPAPIKSVTISIKDPNPLHPQRGRIPSFDSITLETHDPNEPQLESPLQPPVSVELDDKLSKDSNQLIEIEAKTEEGDKE